MLVFFLTTAAVMLALGVLAAASMFLTLTGLDQLISLLARARGRHRGGNE
jgi:uncharacterized membrane protein YdfJ with MMPL/SSD domain